MSSRNLKIRALENGVYDQFNLTRIRFEVTPDLMTTDMGNSYLALRTVLKNSITRLPVDTQQSPNEVPVFFCLGDGITAYDGTALFRTARLFNKATGAVIEELNFNSIRTNTFKEFTADFDNLASNTIQSGLGIPDSVIDNLQSTYTLWTNAKNNTVELHVPLKSIYPSLNVPFYQLSAVGGLIVDLELDTTHPLVMSYSNPQLVIPPPPVLSSGKVGFNTVEQEEFSWLVTAQINSQFLPIQKPFAVQEPYGWEFERVDEDVSPIVRYWESLTGLVYGLPAVGVYAGTDKYEWHGAERQSYTAADLTQLTLVPLGTASNPTFFAEVHTTLLTAGEPIPFVFSDTIIGQATTNLQFSRTHQPCRVGTQGVLGARFDKVVAPVATTDKKGVNPQSLSLSVTQAEFDTLKLARTITITEAEETALVTAGILREEGNLILANEATTFELYLQMQDTANATIYMTPDRATVVDGIPSVVTNQKYQLPVQSQIRLNVELYAKVGEVRTLTFSDPLELDFDNAEDRPAHRFEVLYDGGVGQGQDVRPATAGLLFIQSVEFARDRLALMPHYPSVDLAEMVLVQYPPVKTPMPKFYRTITVEPFVIPLGLNQHVQNFMLQPNVYNAFVLIPHESSNTDFSTVPSLISGDGRALRFRASIDEVDVVNRDIVFGEYPDSLYWDKLADAFSNSAMSLKTLEGTSGGKGERSVRVFPVRIYGGLVNGVVSFSNFMKRLQIRLDAADGETIQGGTAFLYKEMYKSY
jgi:hypothetical protein